MNDQQQTLAEEMLAVFYKYAPDTTAALITFLLAGWGVVLFNSGVLPDERWVTDEFCEKLAKHIEGYRLEPIRKKGKKILGIKELDMETRSWGQKWSRLSYPLAIDAFVEIVYRWLSTVDLRDEITDNSPNQLVYYLRGFSE